MDRLAASWNSRSTSAVVRSLRFFTWCEYRGLTRTATRPFDVATYIETLQLTHSAPGVKQQLAAVRMLFGLADHRPSHAGEPGINRARTEAWTSAVIV